MLVADRGAALFPLRPGTCFSLFGLVLAVSWTGLFSWQIRIPSAHASSGRAAVTTLDRDGDGLADVLEDALLETYAPDALLAPDEVARPASLSWIRGRSTVSRVTLEYMGALLAAPVPDEARRGSGDPADWTVYGHAYPRADGGVELQYWFYYPFNDGPLFFDHDGDWEHVSVELGADLTPRWFAAAAHNENAPGHRLAWEAVERDGSHPRFYVGRGTHAAYARRGDAPFWEGLAEPAEAVVWRPGRTNLSGSSALVNVVERGRARLPSQDEAAFFDYQGIWGAAVRLWGGAAPYGPPYQRGFCVDAAQGSCG
jgi:hypothetical protein